MEPVQATSFLSQSGSPQRQGDYTREEAGTIVLQDKINQFKTACLKLQEVRNAEIGQLLKDMAVFEQRVQGEKGSLSVLECDRVDVALKIIQKNTFPIEYPEIFRSVEELLMPFSDQNRTEFVCLDAGEPAQGAFGVCRDAGCDILKHFRSTSPLSPLQSVCVKQMDATGLICISLSCHESKRKELNEYLVAFGYHSSYSSFNSKAFYVIRPLLERQSFRPADLQFLEDLMSRARIAGR